MIDPDDIDPPIHGTMALVLFGVVMVLACGMIRGMTLLIERPRQPHTPLEFQNPNLPPDFPR